MIVGCLRHEDLHLAKPEGKATSVRTATHIVQWSKPLSGDRTRETVRDRKQKRRQTSTEK